MELTEQIKWLEGNSRAIEKTFCDREVDKALEAILESLKRLYKMDTSWNE